jgi:glycosyltransferase involved in cell wall biosynthesis
MFLIHAVLGTLRVPLSRPANGTVLVAGSHFLPDVVPVYLKGQGKGVRRVVFIHHIVADMPRAKSLTTQLATLQERLCFWMIKRRFDAIITVNDDVALALKRRGFGQSVLVSTNFIDNHGTQPVAYQSKPYTLVFCGRMVKQKGVYDFLKICKALQSEVPDFRAIMIGAGPELEHLRAQAAEQNLAVEFPGRVDDATKFTALAGGKIFLFPSIEEGWGIAIAEAISVGTSVLAYGLPVYKTVFDDCIHTAPLANADALLERARSLLATYDSQPDSYADDQQRIAEFARRFQRDDVVEKEYQFSIGAVDG